MTSRSVRPKVLRNLRRLRSGARHSASAVLQVNLDRKPDTAAKQGNTAAGTTDSGIDFTDSKQLLSSVSTPKLIKSLTTLHAAAVGPVAHVGSWIMRSRLMDQPLCRRMVLGFTERTFYDHFCAGKDLAAANATARKLWESGLSAMLDYGLEHANDNESCDSNMEEFLHTFDSIMLGDDCHVSFVVVKVTAICPPRLLQRVSDLLRWEYRDKSLKLPWKLKTLPLITDSSPFYHTPIKPEPLTPDEEHELELAYERMSRICEKSYEVNLPLLIDAEDTAMQPAIDYFAYSAALKYRTSTEEPPLIYNTIQAYLRDAKDRLVMAKQAADEMGISVGIKLVRGAYMSSENRLAASLGAESPIHDGIQRTHACYNECAEFMLEEIAGGAGSIVLATHNIESGKLAAKKAVSLGMDRGGSRLQFAQLYGMAETLSFGLRNAGFRVSKYLPFGPVEQIMPYLLRRAEENRGLLSASAVDRPLMRKELIRRLMSPGS